MSAFVYVCMRVCACDVYIDVYAYVMMHIFYVHMHAHLSRISSCCCKTAALRNLPRIKTPKPALTLWGSVESSIGSDLVGPQFEARAGSLQTIWIWASRV